MDISTAEQIWLGELEVTEVWYSGRMIWPVAGLSLSADRATIYWYNGAPYLYVNVVPTFVMGSVVTHPNVSYTYTTNLLEYQNANRFKGRATGNATIYATYSYGGNTYSSNVLSISVQDYYECTYGLSTGRIYWYSGATTREAQLSYALLENGNNVYGTPTYSITAGGEYVTLNTSTGRIGAVRTGGPCRFACSVAYNGKTFVATQIGITELVVADWITHSVSVTPTTATIYTDGSQRFDVLYHTTTNGIDATEEVTADAWSFVGRELRYAGNVIYGGGYADTYDFCAEYNGYYSNYVSMVVRAHDITYRYEFNISPLTIELQVSGTVQLAAHYQKIEYVDGQYSRVVEDFDVVKQDYENLTWIYDSNYVRIHDITAVLTAEQSVDRTIISAEYMHDGIIIEPEQEINAKITEPVPVYEPMNFYYIQGGYYLDYDETIDDASSELAIRDDADNLHQYTITCDDSDIHWTVSGFTIYFDGITSSTTAMVHITEASSGSDFIFRILGR